MSSLTQKVLIPCVCALTLLLLAGILAPGLVRAANEQVHGEFDSWAWGTDNMSASLGGTFICMHTSTRTDSSSEFKFRKDGSSYWGSGSAVTFEAKFTVSDSGGNSSFNETSGRVYIWKWNGGSSAVLFEVMESPASISSTSRVPAGTVYGGQAVKVAANLSGSLPTGQGVYLRYTTDGWSTSTVVEMTGSGTTYSADIPGSANTAGANVSYYLFTSGDGLSIAHADADLFTINYLNNGGSNYSYTVSNTNTKKTAQAGDWNQTSTWEGGSIPESTDPVTILHNVNLTDDRSVGSLLISAGTLNGGSGTLTIADGGEFANNSTFSAGTGTVVFAGVGTVSGAVTFNNVTLSAQTSAKGVNFGSSSTVNGTLTINNYRYVDTTPPTYGSASTLKYDTGGSYDISSEWKAGTSGAGVPYNVEIASGTSLNLANAGGTARTAQGDVLINGGLTLGDNSGEDLNVGGNWTNNGTFTHNNRTVTFNKNGNQTISGSSTTAFGYITLNMGTSNANVLDVQSVISMLADGLTLSNGTFRLSSASTITPFAGNTTIPSTAGFYLNHASAVSNWGSSGSLTVNGALTIAAGTMTVGSGSGNELEINGASATVTVSGGILKVAGRVRAVSSGLLTISGGEVIVPTVSHSSSTNASFYMQPTGRLTMAGGTVTIERANGSTGGDIKIESGSGSKSITGGTFQVGNASTPASQTILVNSAVAIHNLTVNSANATARLSAGLTANGNVHIAAGTLDANNLNLAVAGNWTNDGTFTPGSGTVTCNGSSAQTIGGNSTTAFNNLTINNASGVTLDQSQTVNGSLTLTNGRLTLGSYDLTLGVSASVAGTFGDSRMIVADDTGVLRKQYDASHTSFTYPIGDNTGGANYSPITLTFTSATAWGTASVQVKDALHPENNSQHRITRYWPVTASGISGFNCTVTCTYVDEDVEGTETSINGLKYDAPPGSGWTVYNPVNATTNVFSMTVSSFSDFTGGNNPTGITLASFTATDCLDHVLVEWKTSTEMDLVGFNLHRAPASAGPFTQLNPLLIPARNPGSPLGAAYAYTDTTVTAGPYWYKLELHTTSGSEWTDPIPMHHYPYRLYLPLVSRP